MVSTDVEANGSPGVQGGGGGSGGAVSIDFFSLFLFNSNSISAKGGFSRSSGGGGRVRMFDHNWLQQTNSLNSNISISAAGGLGCNGPLTCGESGSVTTSPCPPGY